MERESFIFYRSFYEAIRCMPPDMQVEIYTAICEYALFGKLPKNLSEVTKGMLTLMKPNIDVNTARYENGKKGGRKRTNKPASTDAETAYSISYEQEVEQMRNDEEWRKSICEDFSITEDEYHKRLSRFLDLCINDKKRKGKERHNSYADCQSHLRYWMSKAYPIKHTTTHATDNDSAPFPEIGDSFGGMDYDEQ